LNESVSSWHGRLADDPFEVHSNPRPGVVLSPENRPYGDEECTVVCLGTHAEERYELDAPHLSNEYIDGLSFNRKTYVLPWALYTIPLGTIDESEPIGQLGDDGTKLAAQSIYRMMRQ
jgi:hypothetical protein